MVDVSKAVDAGVPWTIVGVAVQNVRETHAFLKADDGTHIRLDEHAEGWPEKFHEKRVSVSGKVVSQKIGDSEETEPVFLSPTYHEEEPNPDQYLKKD